MLINEGKWSIKREDSDCFGAASRTLHFSHRLAMPVGGSDDTAHAREGARMVVFLHVHPPPTTPDPSKGRAARLDATVTCSTCAMQVQERTRE